MPEYQWPVLWPKDIDPDTLEEDVREIAEDLAVATLRQLTLNRVGLTEVEAYPCTTNVREVILPRGPLNYEIASYHLRTGCRPVGGRKIRLIAPIRQVLSVTLDGEALVDPEDVSIVDGGWLIRADGKDWPGCGADFKVAYVTGYPVPKMGQYAAGVLAYEYTKALNGKDCGLPSGVTEISRQGVSYTIDQSLFPGGHTGLKDVDAFINLWNPHGMKTRPKVYSPDVSTGHTAVSGT